MVDWTQVLVALAAGLPATLMAAAALIASLKNTTKIDENTTITKQAGDAAVTNAAAAADAAKDAKAVAEDTNEKLNGVLEDKIAGIVRRHTEPLAQSVGEIKTALKDLASRVEGIKK